MKLSVIITHYKTPELLITCINSIKDTVKNTAYEIIVVDSETEKKHKELIIEKHPDINFIGFNKNVGYAKLVNAGLKEAKGEFLLILNADIIMLGSAIEKLIDYAEKNNDVGIIGPQLLDFTNNIQTSCFSDPDWGAILARRTFLGKLKWGRDKLKKFAISEWDKKSIREVDWVQGSAMLVKKSLVDKIDLMDERFFMYFEDADWCRRSRKAGYKVVYLPEAQMSHYYHRASKKWGFLLDLLFNKYTRIHILSSIKYFSKWKNYEKNK